MKEKPFYFPFNEYVRLFEKITECRINPQKDIIEKRFKRFFKKFNIYPENVFLVETKILTNRECLDAFIDVFIPVESFFLREEDYLHLAISLAKREKSKSILVAPCASGEGVYSLKIIAEENSIKDLSITGIDISEKAIEAAKKGVYPESSIKNIPSTLFKKYFNEENNNCYIQDKLKNNIDFKVQNLAKLNNYNRYDIIICRNFLIYLQGETIKLILKNLYNALKINGVLILGKSELSLIKFLPEFRKERKNKLVYFRKVS